ncbi:MAG: hypothetical protein JNL58_09595 [Planctomyces sp.]|nr:hypothetical protein [Planctomyces sp.]
MFCRFSAILTLLSACGMLASIGCGGGPRIPETVSVSGKVTYKDQPLADALVGFVSKLDNKDVLAARGTTNSNGEFTLSTYIDPQHEVSGATPGEFIVTVTKNEQQDMQKIMEEFKKNPAMQFKKLVPEKYSDGKNSPLTATVKADGENAFEFKLED